LRPSKAVPTRDALWIFLLAIGIRALFLVETRSDPLFGLLAIDARSYFELAGRFASGDFLYGHETLWFAPLYPVLLGTLFRIVGPVPFAVRILQFVLGAGTAVLGARIALRLGTRRASRITGVLLALLPVPIFYENQLLYTSWAVFLTALFLSLFLEDMNADGAGRPFLSGLSLGALGLVRANSLLFLPVGALLLARMRRGRAALVFCGGCLLVLAPLIVRNGLVAGTWTPFTANGGMIFATSFAEDSLGGRALVRSPRDFWPHGAFHREAERIAGRELTLAEASRVHRDATLARIREHPGWALRLTLAKLALLVNAHEIDDNLNFATLRDRSRVLAWLPAPWAFVALPGVAGAWLVVSRRGPRSRAGKVLVLFAAVYAISILLFFVTGRYRLPLVVPGAVLAGLAVDTFSRAPAQRRWRPLIAPAAVALLAAVPVLRDPGVRADPALELVAIGAALERSGQHEDALAATDAALALDPTIAGAHQNRALSLLALGRAEDAYGAAAEAVRLDPELAPAWQTCGAILAARNDYTAALVAYGRAVDLDPENADALAGYARVLALTGNFGDAVRIGERARAAGAELLERELERWRREAGSENDEPPGQEGRRAGGS
jgi:tetratricopeptide (TPR) repeat protein